jgi:hypothetical protein
MVMAIKFEHEAQLTLRGGSINIIGVSRSEKFLEK